MGSIIDMKSNLNMAHTDGDTITLEARFFNDGIFELTTTDPFSIKNPRQGRAQTFLHELGHVVGILISPDNYGFATDPQSPANQNEKSILDHCSSGLSKVRTSY